MRLFVGLAWAIPLAIGCSSNLDCDDGTHPKNGLCIADDDGGESGDEPGDEPVEDPVDEVVDSDGDGVADGDDCDDNTAATNPAAYEVCDAFPRAHCHLHRTHGPLPGPVARHASFLALQTSLSTVTVANPDYAAYEETQTRETYPQEFEGICGQRASFG